MKLRYNPEQFRYEYSIKLQSLPWIDTNYLLQSDYMVNPHQFQLFCGFHWFSYDTHFNHKQSSDLPC